MILYPLTMADIAMLERRLESLMGKNEKAFLEKVEPFTGKYYPKKAPEAPDLAQDGDSEISGRMTPETEEPRK